MVTSAPALQFARTLTILRANCQQVRAIGVMAAAFSLAGG